MAHYELFMVLAVSKISKEASEEGPVIGQYLQVQLSIRIY